MIPAKPPSVTIIVLNYNSLEHLPANLSALHQLDFPAGKLEILLVDNDSTDGSVAWARQNYPGLRVVQNGANLGFAGGNNAGAEAATGEWLAFVNPDVRVSSDWLAELVQPVHEEPGVSSVASKMLNWDGTAVDFAAAAINFMGWGNQLGIGSQKLAQFDERKPFLFACGGAMLVRRDVFLDAGGFDPDYFAYFEDVDLGWRLWLLGHRVVYTPRAVVFHRHHGSWQSVNDAKKWLLAERNTLYTIVKNYEDDHLARILPAALLLMLQRAFLDVRPDPAYFGLPPAGPRNYWGYYAHELWQMVRRGRGRELAERGVAEVRRRLERLSPEYVPMEPVSQQWQPAANGRFTVPAVAFSRLLAGRDAQRHWPALWNKRRALQARRQRSDKEIFPLFQWALRSNFGDIQFIYAMNQVIAKFKLVKLFAGSPSLPPPSAAERELSDAVSRQLLHLMDRAFALSQVDDGCFRLGTPDPEAVYTVPEACVAILAHANQWLWSLPDGNLGTVLGYLQQQVEKWEVPAGEPANGARELQDAGD
jgi:GT2 family glycosyltransferase